MNAKNKTLTREEKLAQAREEEKIIKLYKDGHPVEYIGELFGLTKGRISQIANEHGLRRRNPKLYTHTKTIIK